jgi:hypothetical protein
MRTILRIFQITSVRTAWLFFLFSMGFLLYVLYLVFTEADIAARDPFEGVHRIAVAVLAVYVSVAGFALFTEEGRKIVSAFEHTPRRRTLAWYVKALFACVAVAIAISIACMPLAAIVLGSAADDFLGEYFYALWGAAMLVAFPFVYRYLK